MSTPVQESPDPLAALLADLPRLDATFGAILVGTYVSLVLFGLTIHQAFRYFRIYRQDVPRLRYLVYGLFLADTVYITLCIHASYFYLVRNYFKPLSLKEGSWSLRLLPPLSGVIVVLSQCFYSRRVSLMGSWYKTLVSIVIVLIIGEVGFTIAGTVEAFSWKKLDHWHQVTWLSAGAWSFAVAVEAILSTTLIIVLRKSRTGFKRTDSVLDILTGYTINTGVLTGTASVVCLAVAFSTPNKLIYIGCNMVTTMLYSNSTLAVLNSRKFLAEQALGGFDPTAPSFDWSGMQTSNRVIELAGGGCVSEQRAVRSMHSVIHIRGNARAGAGQESLGVLDETSSRVDSL